MERKYGPVPHVGHLDTQPLRSRAGARPARRHPAARKATWCTVPDAVRLRARTPARGADPPPCPSPSLPDSKRSRLSLLARTREAHRVGQEVGRAGVAILPDRDAVHPADRVLGGHRAVAPALQSRRPGGWRSARAAGRPDRRRRAPARRSGGSVPRTSPRATAAARSRSPSEPGGIAERHPVDLAGALAARGARRSRGRR